MEDLKHPRSPSSPEFAKKLRLSPSADQDVAEEEDFPDSADLEMALAGPVGSDPNNVLGRWLLPPSAERMRVGRVEELGDDHTTDEIDVGISEYVDASIPTFTGIIKQR